MTDFEMLHVSQAACKTLTFLMLVSLNMSAWLIVLTTVDRFVAVWLPLRAVAVCRHRRACLAVVVLFVVISAFNIHVFWTAELRFNTNRRSPMCMVLGPPYIVVFECVKLASYSIVPFVAILLLNCAIVARLRLGRSAILRGGGSRWSGSMRIGGRASSPGTLVESRGPSPARGGRQCGNNGPTLSLAVGASQLHRARSHRPTSSAASSLTTTTSSSGAATAASSPQSKVTYMLLPVSITWLVLTAPWTLRTVVALAGGVTADDPRGIKQFVTTMCFLLMYVNHAINFYLYCVTGCKFRRELVDMLTMMCVVRRASSQEDGGGRMASFCRCLSRSCCCCYCASSHRGVNRSASDSRSEMRAFSVVASSRHGNNMGTALSLGPCKSRRCDVNQRPSEAGGVDAADTAVWMNVQLSLASNWQNSRVQILRLLAFVRWVIAFQVPAVNNFINSALWNDRLFF